MTTQSKPDSVMDDSLTEATVEAYLRAHPDFFERHVSLLDILKLPHPSGGAVSLIERQVGLLRDKNRHLERKLMDLVQVARDNEHLSTRLHHLALALMDADSLDATLATVQEQLREEFKADHAVIRLLGDPESAAYFVDAQDSRLMYFEDLFKNKRPVCGRLQQDQLNFLFTDDAPRIASAVMVPLISSERVGLLALGSHEESRFHPGMGTLFLGYLGELISKAIAAYHPRT